MKNFHRTFIPHGYVSLNQACSELGISRPTLNRWIKKLDDILKITVNEMHYIRQEDVERIRQARMEMLVGAEK